MEKNAEMNGLQKNFMKTSFSTMDTGSHNEAQREEGKPKVSFPGRGNHQGSWRERIVNPSTSENIKRVVVSCHRKRESREYSLQFRSDRTIALHHGFMGF